MENIVFEKLDEKIIEQRRQSETLWKQKRKRMQELASQEKIWQELGKDLKLENWSCPMSFCAQAVDDCIAIMSLPQEDGDNDGIHFSIFPDGNNFGIVLEFLCFKLFFKLAGHEVDKKELDKIRTKDKYYYVGLEEAPEV